MPRRPARGSPRSTDPARERSEKNPSTAKSILLRLLPSHSRGRWKSTIEPGSMPSAPYRSGVHCIQKPSRMSAWIPRGTTAHSGTGWLHRAEQQPCYIMNLLSLRSPAATQLFNLSRGFQASMASARTDQPHRMKDTEIREVSGNAKPSLGGPLRLGSTGVHKAERDSRRLAQLS